jgi:hypothetical protein
MAAVTEAKTSGMILRTSCSMNEASSIDGPLRISIGGIEDVFV